MSRDSSEEHRRNGRGHHPGSRAGMKNLVPYKPGQSGNPGGRPKGIPSIEHAIYRLLALTPDDLEELSHLRLALCHAYS